MPKEARLLLVFGELGLFQLLHRLRCEVPLLFAMGWGRSEWPKTETLCGSACVVHNTIKARVIAPFMPWPSILMGFIVR
jgi:hypothetical protein